MQDALLDCPVRAILVCIYTLLETRAYFLILQTTSTMQLLQCKWQHKLSLNDRPHTGRA